MMTREDIYLDERRALKENPTKERWGIEIRRILEGERESSLQRRGSVEEHVGITLDLAADRAKSVAAFHDALSAVVRSWQPSALDLPRYLAYMIDLINAYRPKIGFSRIIETLRSVNLPTEFEDPKCLKPRDLRLEALLLLGGYSLDDPSSRAEELIRFRSYIDILREHLQDPRYSGYAACCLVQSRVARLNEPIIANVVVDTRSDIQPILSYALSFTRKEDREEAVSEIHNSCFPDSASFKRLLTEMQTRGFDYGTHDDSGLPMFRSAGDIVIIRPPGDRDQRYEQYGIRINRTNSTYGRLLEEVGRTN